MSKNNSEINIKGWKITRGEREEEISIEEKNGDLGMGVGDLKGYGLDILKEDG